MTTQDYFIILTSLGEAIIAAAIAEGTQIELTEMAVGDADYTPSKGQTSLVNEQWRGDLNTLSRDPQNLNYVVAEAIIPEDVGGWDIREVGIFDNNGDLFAIGKYPLTYKPILSQGSGKDLYIRFIMEVSTEAQVTLQVDPAVVLASRKYVDDEIDALTAIVAAGDSPVKRIKTQADSPYTVTAQDLAGNVCITNIGATGELVCILPVIGATDKVAFYVAEGQNLKVVADATQRFRMLENLTALGGYLQSSTVGTFWIIEGINDEWVVTVIQGQLDHAGGNFKSGGTSNFLRTQVFS